MRHGADNHQRPAIRREKLNARVKTILKLLAWQASCITGRHGP